MLADKAKVWLCAKGGCKMSVSVELVGDEILLNGGGLRCSLPVSVGKQIAALLPTDHASTSLAPLVLDDDHVMWDHHSGGDRHKGEPWAQPGALDDARALRRYLPTMGSAFFELLLSEPGRLFTSEEICEQLPMFKSPAAVAGSLNGFVKPKNENGRPFPFYWWEGADGKPTRYAVRPSVANVFIAAGD